MRAVLCKTLDGVDALTLETIDPPKPGAGEVLIRVHVAALNFPDLLIVEGRYQVKPPLPFVPGMEMAGVVHGVGEGVEGLRIGDRVSAVVTWGAFAEFAIAHAERVVALPDTMDFGVGAALGLAYQTVWHALKSRARLRKGETLLVLGASGGVGLAAVQLGRQVGATVIAAASSPEKLDVCLAQGADHAINYRDSDLRKEIQAIVGSNGVDVVLDPVGGAYAEPALRSLGWRGRYLVVGFAEGTVPKLPLNLALLSERDIMGVYVGEFFRREPQARLDLARELTGFVAAGHFAPVISASFPLARYGEAMKALQGRVATGKILLTMSAMA
ncbi:MAG: NADPH:quinone oxidoreductase [Rhizobiales bacterium 62-47]|nr:NADPH:quinone oxidoreductase family protein [Hyphomicrobiales bacterium]OJY12781.1 MAG: NADPH:quinone oxidoreductase [Rhizobiales bacterium 62-47]